MKSLSIRIVLLAILIPALSSCNRNIPKDVPILKRTVTSALPFPREKVELPIRLTEAIASAKSVEQIFLPPKLLKLEMPEDLVIGEITDGVCLPGRWVILDLLQKSVFLFDDQGHFIKSVGKSGQGPDEYLLPILVERIYGGNIGIVDGMSGSILIFDKDGNYLKRTPTKINGYHIFATSKIIWRDPNLLYMADVPVYNPDTPWHFALDLSDPQLPSLLYGFGDRHYRFDKSRTVFRAFEEISGMIWTGSPYRSHLDVYDSTGAFAASIGKGRANGIEEKDYDKIGSNNAKDVKDLKKLNFNTGIYPTDHVVLSLIGNEFDIYDRNGNTLKRYLKRGWVGGVVDSFGSTLVTSLPVLEKASDYPERFRQPMTDAGIDLSNNENDNPYLMIFNLVL